MSNYFFEIDSSTAKSSLSVLPAVSVMMVATTPFVNVDNYSTQSATADNQATLKFYNPLITQSNTISNVVAKKETGKFAKTNEQRKVHKFNLPTRYQKPSFS